MFRLIFLSTMLVLAGCTSWPERGRNGMAEWRHTGTFSIQPGHPLTPEHGLKFDLELCRRHLDVLVLEGAELCFPATVVQARSRENRIARALYGGLPLDAENDLIIQRQLLSRLEKKLDYVRHEKICILPPLKTRSNSREHIEQLLNDKNIFLPDSVNLTPEYMGDLAEASRLIKDLPSYHLRISEYNNQAYQTYESQSAKHPRAKMIARHLQLLGLKKDHIEIDPIETNNPSFADVRPERQIENRQITIKLIESPKHN